ncbi:CRISPR-associated ring nuclease [Halorarius litoreus]|uniref:CRISPR-associated ring nuclease n=1 Tax=Halorarius litoreus TaxID=2962676 RepID=UPI0020CC8243|nr:CRISPR-associated ring nuclease [Halorarius litoreus]
MRYWVTTGSTNPEAVVNPLAAACTEWGYEPDRVFLLGNPGVADQLDRIASLAATIIEAHSGETPDIQRTELDSETDFQAVVDHFRAAIEAARADGGEVVVDITPGRKFMSAIAFQAGIQFGADRVAYLHVHSGRLFGRVYADLPRSGTTLYDFTEVFA